MDLALPSWLTSLLKTPLSAVGKAFKGFRSRRRIKQRLENLPREGRLALNGMYRAAANSDDRLFGWTITGGGLNPAEAFLPFLIDEGALVPVREEEKPNERTTWYQLKPWLFNYLNKRPELLKEDYSNTAI
ncbi:hypothetical protein GQ464_002425 [Rhodocaloribacter litoris]|uniref:hypothetical protein n=1 Tax=Rhodocaloribacter litoris TaxID=2558931 RepID=UPI001423F6D4|nr:hypothetical protein [Rhodocaloribacter litoris]QXD15824.1 hypothetical protein GQ464_002425 [Rhodocaloribacter litoris]